MAEETISDILQGLMPAVEATEWLHGAVAEVLSKLNEAAPAAIRFSASMDSDGNINLVCSRQSEQIMEDAGEQQWGFGVPSPFMPPMPMLINSSQVSIGHFSNDQNGVIFACDEQNFNRRGQMVIHPVVQAEDVERLVAMSLRTHWESLFGMVSQAVYGDQYAAAEPEQPMVVEEVDLSCDSLEGQPALDHLVVEPRFPEW